jgi:hypothetical protein
VSPRHWAVYSGRYVYTIAHVLPIRIDGLSQAQELEMIAARPPLFLSSLRVMQRRMNHGAEGLYQRRKKNKDSGIRQTAALIKIKFRQEEGLFFQYKTAFEAHPGFEGEYLIEV